MTLFDQAPSDINLSTNLVLIALLSIPDPEMRNEQVNANYTILLTGLHTGRIELGMDQRSGCPTQ